jgi:hypothetical protein
MTAENRVSPKNFPPPLIVAGEKLFYFVSEVVVPLSFLGGIRA